MRTWQRRNCRSTSPVPLRRFAVSEARRHPAATVRMVAAEAAIRCSRWSSFLLLSLVRPLLWFSSTAAAGSRIALAASGFAADTARRNCAHRHRLHTIGLETFGAAVDLVVDLTPTVKGCGHRMAARPFAVRRDAGQAAGRGRRCRSLPHLGIATQRARAHLSGSAGPRR